MITYSWPVWYGSKITIRTLVETEEIELLSHKDSHQITDFPLAYQPGPVNNESQKLIPIILFSNGPLSVMYALWAGYRNILCTALPSTVTHQPLVT